MRYSLIDKVCRGCSHPTICKTHGCGVTERRANKAAQENQASDKPLTEQDVRRIVREELARQGEKP